MRQVSAFPAQQRLPSGSQNEAAAAAPATADASGWRGKVRGLFRRPKAGQEPGQEAGPGAVEPPPGAEGEAAAASGQAGHHEDANTNSGTGTAAPSQGVHLAGKALSWPAATIPLPEGLDYDEEEDGVEMDANRPPEPGAEGGAEEPGGPGASPAERRGVSSFASVGSDVTEWDYPLARQAESNRLTGNFVNLPMAMPGNFISPAHGGYDCGFGEQAAARPGGACAGEGAGPEQPQGVHLRGNSLTWPAATVPLLEGQGYDEEEEDDEVETDVSRLRCAAEGAQQPLGLAMTPPPGRGLASFGSASAASGATDWAFPAAAAPSRPPGGPAGAAAPARAAYGRDLGEQAAFVHMHQAPEAGAEAQLYPGQAQLAMAMQLGQLGQLPMYCPAPLMMAPPFPGAAQPPWGCGPLDPAALGAGGPGGEDLEDWARQQMEGWRSVAEAARRAKGPGGPEARGAPARGSASSSAGGAAAGGGRGSQRRVGTEAFAVAGANEECSRTTVMLRNLPNDYTRNMLLKLLDDEGFNCKYNFVYLPVDFKRMAGLGYAFVNMDKHEYAQEIWKHFDGFNRWTLSSPKVCQVAWGEPLQGLEAHIERYRNSPVMHPDVDEMFKPVVFKNGQRQTFPAPTKRLRQPRMKYRTPVDGRASTASADPAQAESGDGGTASSKFVD